MQIVSVDKHDYYLCVSDAERKLQISQNTTNLKKKNYLVFISFSWNRSVFFQSSECVEIHTCFGFWL